VKLFWLVSSVGRTLILILMMRVLVLVKDNLARREALLQMMPLLSVMVRLVHRVRQSDGKSSGH
jgi:hypothetical protein